MQIWSLRKYGLHLIVIIGTFAFLWTMYGESLIRFQETLSSEVPVQLLQIGGPNHAEDFLVSTDKCKIPNVDPWNSEVQPLYIRRNYVECSDKKKLTKIVYETNGVFLEVDQVVKQEYSRGPISCCYSNITRGQEENPDLGISVSPCHSFESKVQLGEVSVFVRCKTTDGATIYSNTHSLLPKILDVEPKLKMANEHEPPSILLIGIDSMSRLNFHRVFSKTKGYLQRNNWIEYKGYNKVGDNTLPNIMALLTGKNLTTVLKECDPRKRVEQCNFIWQEYSKLGYMTAYVEDEITISTFTTYSFKGFRTKPTDFYYMPYLTASERLLPVKKLDGMTYCAGMETSAERVLNIVKEMVVNYPKQRKFGFFWMNSFSHEDINAPARVDEIFADFLLEIQKYIDNNTIVIFFSDHGIRFGNIRITRSGWLEERLPFLYFWIPNEFKRKFPREAQYLVRNSAKLTTPYDIYMTLQHVLTLYNLNYSLKQSDACANCKSLFTQIEDRSCEEASIQFHWCTCFGYKHFDSKSELVSAASKFAIDEINARIYRDKQMYYRCMRFTLRTTISAGISSSNRNNKTFLLLIFETVPKAKFEVTVSVNYDDGGRYFINEGSTSRLDRYEPTSACITENKIYCYCRWNLLWRLNFFSFWFEI